MRKSITNDLSAESNSFHTFTSPEEQDKKFVTIGLSNQKIEDINNCFITQDVSPKYISMMKSKKETPQEYPLYFLSIDLETDPNEIYATSELCTSMDHHRTMYK